MDQTCILCASERTMNCFGVRCCLDCKREIAKRPRNMELLAYIDTYYKQNGLGNQVHQRLFRFWYDTVGRAMLREKFLDKFRQRATLIDLCCDQIIRNEDLIYDMICAVPECAPPWTNLLKAFWRWKHIRGRKPNKDPFNRVLHLVNSEYTSLTISGTSPP